MANWLTQTRGWIKESVLSGTKTRQQCRAQVLQIKLGTQPNNPPIGVITDGLHKIDVVFSTNAMDVYRDSPLASHGGTLKGVGILVRNFNIVFRGEGARVVMMIDRFDYVGGQDNTTVINVSAIERDDEVVWRLGLHLLETTHKSADFLARLTPSSSFAASQSQQEESSQPRNSDAHDHGGIAQQLDESFSKASEPTLQPSIVALGPWHDALSPFDVSIRPSESFEFPSNPLKMPEGRANPEDGSSSPHGHAFGSWRTDELPDLVMEPVNDSDFDDLDDEPNNAISPIHVNEPNVAGNTGGPPLRTPQQSQETRPNEGGNLAAEPEAPLAAEEDTSECFSPKDEEHAVTSPSVLPQDSLELQQLVDIMEEHDSTLRGPSSCKQHSGESLQQDSSIGSPEASLPSAQELLDQISDGSAPSSSSLPQPREQVQTQLGGDPVADEDNEVRQIQPPVAAEDEVRNGDSNAEQRLSQPVVGTSSSASGEVPSGIIGMSLTQVDREATANLTELLVIQDGEEVDTADYHNPDDGIADKAEMLPERHEGDSKHVADVPRETLSAEQYQESLAVSLLVTAAQHIVGSQELSDEPGNQGGFLPSSPSPIQPAAVPNIEAESTPAVLESTANAGDIQAGATIEKDTPNQSLLQDVTFDDEPRYLSQPQTAFQDISIVVDEVSVNVIGKSHGESLDDESGPISSPKKRKSTAIAPNVPLFAGKNDFNSQSHDGEGSLQQLLRNSLPSSPEPLPRQSAKETHVAPLAVTTRVESDDDFSTPAPQRRKLADSTPPTGHNQRAYSEYSNSDSSSDSSIFQEQYPARPKTSSYQRIVDGDSEDELPIFRDQSPVSATIRQRSSQGGGHDSSAASSRNLPLPQSLALGPTPAKKLKSPTHSSPKIIVPSSSLSAPPSDALDHGEEQARPVPSRSTHRQSKTPSAGSLTKEHRDLISARSSPPSSQEYNNFNIVIASTPPDADASAVCVVHSQARSHHHRSSVSPTRGAGGQFTDANTKKRKINDMTNDSDDEDDDNDDTFVRRKYPKKPKPELPLTPSRNRVRSLASKQPPSSAPGSLSSASSRPNAYKFIGAGTTQVRANHTASASHGDGGDDDDEDSVLDIQIQTSTSHGVAKRTTAAVQAATSSPTPLSPVWQDKPKRANTLVDFLRSAPTTGTSQRQRPTQVVKAPPKKPSSAQNGSFLSLPETRATKCDRLYSWIED